MLGEDATTWSQEIAPQAVPRHARSRAQVQALRSTSRDRAGNHVVINPTALPVQSANLFIHSRQRPYPPT